MSDLANKTILFVGLGLIGGSLARALRERNPAQKLLATDSDQSALDAAKQQGVVDQTGSLQELAPAADICVLAAPPLALIDLIPEVASLCPSHTVFTDVASVKSHVLSAIDAQPESFAENFVLGHPIAGSERSGFQAASVDLFQGRKTILCPLERNSSQAVAQVNELWRQVGADVIGMTPERHDQVLAATSHLPHLLAFAIVDVLLHQEQSDDIFRYAAGGFADFSRVASSDSTMWSDIFVANAEATESVLDEYIAALRSLKESIHNRDRAVLQEVFNRAKQTRDRFVHNHYQGNSTQAVSDNLVTLITAPGGTISGSLRVPGDKSISHRSVIFGALADGITKVSGFLEGEDALKTVAAFREMGVTIVGPDNGEMTIYGVGKEGLQKPRIPLDMGNSGTAMRLMAGLLAAQAFDSELFGDESLNSRPMGRIADPLRAMGAAIETDGDGTPPLKITGKKLRGTHYDMPVASAQVKSCLLLAGLFAEGTTSVTEPAICRDHTERMLKGFGHEVEGGYPESTTSVTGNQQLKAATIDVPADISSAAFFLVAASIAPESELLLEHVGINPTRIGVINILRAMGATISFENEREVGGEPVADIQVKSSELHGVEIPADQVPLAIDEFPVLFVAAACAEGETVLRGAEELRVKESDRIDAMASGLKTLGVEVETYPDGIRIVGGDLGGGKVDSLGDHRIAMAFAVAGLRADDSIEIANAENVATSFPGFTSLANAAGFKLTELAG
ncbi:MAG: bifunctional prephenate dehydrogenase/3-phosphoshikimate 1-carboxyvinyltransferase [Pseudomonadales bacterium]|nr:bifunctional prephenate dehydrogenase/3-phosphoshikimate 1-carboxyvinyltransferase [Pseudomonadales bacterium]